MNLFKNNMSENLTNQIEKELPINQDNPANEPNQTQIEKPIQDQSNRVEETAPEKELNQLKNQKISTEDSNSQPQEQPAAIDNNQQAKEEVHQNPSQEYNIQKRNSDDLYPEIPLLDSMPPEFQDQLEDDVPDIEKDQVSHPVQETLPTNNQAETDDIDKCLKAQPEKDQEVLSEAKDQEVEKKKNDEAQPEKAPEESPETQDKETQPEKGNEDQSEISQENKTDKKQEANPGKIHEIPIAQDKEAEKEKEEETQSEKVKESESEKIEENQQIAQGQKSELDKIKGTLNEIAQETIPVVQAEEPVKEESLEDLKNTIIKLRAQNEELTAKYDKLTSQLKDKSEENIGYAELKKNFEETSKRVEELEKLLIFEKMDSIVQSGSNKANDRETQIDFEKETFLKTKLSETETEIKQLKEKLVIVSEERNSYEKKYLELSKDISQFKSLLSKQEQTSSTFTQPRIPNNYYTPQTSFGTDANRSNLASTVSYKYGSTSDNISIQNSSTNPYTANSNATTYSNSIKLPVSMCKSVHASDVSASTVNYYGYDNKNNNKNFANLVSSANTSRTTSSGNANTNGYAYDPTSNYNLVSSANSSSNGNALKTGSTSTVSVKTNYGYCSNMTKSTGSFGSSSTIPPPNTTVTNTSTPSYNIVSSGNNYNNYSATNANSYYNSSLGNNNNASQPNNTHTYSTSSNIVSNGNNYNTYQNTSNNSTNRASSNIVSGGNNTYTYSKSNNNAYNSSSNTVSGGNTYNAYSSGYNYSYNPSSNIVSGGNTYSTDTSNSNNNSAANQSYSSYGVNNPTYDSNHKKNTPSTISYSSSYTNGNYALNSTSQAASNSGNNPQNQTPLTTNNVNDFYKNYDNSKFDYTNTSKPQSNTVSSNFNYNANSNDTSTNNNFLNNTQLNSNGVKSAVNNSDSTTSLKNDNPLSSENSTNDITGKDLKENGINLSTNVEKIEKSNAQ